MHNHTPRQGQERFVAPTASSELPARHMDTSRPPENQWKQAWKAIRQNWICWFSASLPVIILFVVLLPNLLTSVDPRTAELSNSLGTPRTGHMFGLARQGYDVFSRTIHGARAS